MEERVRDGPKSECLSVMERIGTNVPRRKSADLALVINAREFVESLFKEKSK